MSVSFDETTKIEDLNNLFNVFGLSDQVESLDGVRIKSVKENFKIPVLAYQVSGEYSLLSNGINNKLIDKNVILESLISFKRAGANAIVSYYADRLDKILK